MSLRKLSDVEFLNISRKDAKVAKQGLERRVLTGLQDKQDLLRRSKPFIMTLRHSDERLILHLTEFSEIFIL
jgi:hypothetical protein